MIYLPPGPCIHPWSLESCGGSFASMAGTSLTATSSATWPAASLAIYIPFCLSRVMLPTQINVLNGATANGKTDVGVYSEDGRALSTNGLANQTGTNTIQTFTWASMSYTGVIGPGVFYLAISHNDTVGTVFRGTTAASTLGACGFAQEDLSGAGTPGTLPGTATFAHVANAYVPVVAIFF